MLNVTTASRRVSRSISRGIAEARAHRAAQQATAPRRSSLGETLAVGLGCDRW